MYLSNVFRQSLVFPDMEADSFDRVLEIFAVGMAEETGLVQEEILSQLKKREAILPTFIGNNTALPHNHFPGFNGLVAGFLRLKTPLSFEVGGRMEILKYVICVITGVNNEEHYLPLLAGVAGIMKVLPDFVTMAATPEAFMRGLDGFHKKNSTDLPPEISMSLYPASIQQTVKDAIDLMKCEQVVFLAVTDTDNSVCGVVGVRSLIRAGLPDYILNLNDLSFIKEFKPLEKFWDSEDVLRIKDCMEDPEGYLLPEDTPHLEVLFLMCKYNRRHLITVDSENKYTGIITEAGILNKMLRP